MPSRPRSLLVITAGIYAASPSERSPFDTPTRPGVTAPASSRATTSIGKPEQCLGSLSRAVAASHEIAPSQVIDAVGRRDEVLDALVVLFVAALYGLAASAITRRLFDRFLPDEPWPALVGTAATALLVSAAGVIVGGLGASVVEMIRVGDTHLSYRAFRIPWNQHWLPFYFGGVALFCLIAGARLGVRCRGKKLAE